MWKLEYLECCIYGGIEEVAVGIVVGNSEKKVLEYQ